MIEGQIFLKGLSDREGPMMKVVLSAPAMDNMGDL